MAINITLLGNHFLNKSSVDNTNMKCYRKFYYIIPLNTPKLCFMPYPGENVIVSLCAIA